jgi:hypothetical protein
VRRKGGSRTGGGSPRRGDTRLQSWRKNKYNLVKKDGKGIQAKGKTTGKGARGKRWNRTGFPMWLISSISLLYTLPIYLISNEVIQSSGILGNLDS